MVYCLHLAPKNTRLYFSQRNYPIDLLIGWRARVGQEDSLSDQSEEEYLSIKRDMIEMMAKCKYFIVLSLMMYKHPS